MADFIDKVVQELISTPRDLTRTIIVLPGKRPILFFRKSFQKQAKNIILPQFYSIEEFLNSMAELQPISSISLWFEAYQSYKKITKDAEEFEDFIKWFPTLLNDFEDIDTSLISPGNIFDYLISSERIKKWGEDELSLGKNELIQNHLFFWKIAAKLYHQLKEDLLNKGLGYAGMISREASNKIDSYLNLNENQFVFAGFNALTATERKIIYQFEKENRAQTFWDADAYYMNNTFQEAGFFLRQHKKRAKDWRWTSDDFSKPKHIEVIGISKQVGQAKYVSDLLSDLSEQELQKTAVILADETLLPAILNSLPENITQLNISMGIPLRTVAVAHFFKSIFELQMNREKLGKNQSFYFKNVLEIIENKTFSSFSTSSTRELSKIIRQQNRIFNSEKSLFPYIENTLFASLLKIPTSISSFLLSLKNWIDALLERKDFTDNLLREYLFFFKQTFNHLLTSIQDEKDIKDFKTLYLLYNKILQSETISFLGEPLEGLQLMGLLETRLINFENIIMTSVNDGIIPLGRLNNSLIPYDIRKEMGMNTFLENDSIYAYHFYRLLQGSKNTFLFYNTEADGLGNGEQSRFITQIEFESEHFIKKSYASPLFQTQPKNKLRLEKTKATMEKLLNWAEEGISPSSLISYLRDPIRFYEQRVFDIQELEDAEETISAMTLGNIVHKTLEHLYQPYLNRILHEKDFVEIENKKDKELSIAFKDEYGEGDFSQGQNFLIFQVASKIVSGVLFNDKKTAQKSSFSIRSLEQKKSIDFELNDGRKVKLKGIIDRIDEVDGKLRIIDYKTGSVEDRINISSEKLETVYTDVKQAKALQLIFYAYLFYDNINKKEEIELCIYPLKYPKKGLIKLNYDKSEYVNYSIIEATHPFMSNLIEEILDAEIPFEEKE